MEGPKGGHEVHVEPGVPRVSNIYNKTDAFDRCLECKPLLAASCEMLSEFKLHGASLRDPLPGTGHQDLNVDVTKKFADDWWVTNGIILFDDMTVENGPTRVVPGSHRWPAINVPYVNWFDWEPAPLTPAEEALIPKDLSAPYPGEVHVVAPAGSVVIINSCIWHAGTTKRNTAPPTHPASHIHAPRPAAAAGPARLPRARAVRPDEPRAALPDGHRGARRGHAGASHPEARRSDLVELIAIGAGRETSRPDPDLPPDCQRAGRA
jgi:Phytanoyl-CoA dioxygenase (PhyH)